MVDKVIALRSQRLSGYVQLANLESMNALVNKSDSGLETVSSHSALFSGFCRQLQWPFRSAEVKPLLFFYIYKPLLFITATVLPLADYGCSLCVSTLAFLGHAGFLILKLSMYLQRA